MTSLAPAGASIVEPLTNEQSLLLWVRHGTMTANVEGREYSIGPGRGLWIPPDTTHRLAVSEGGVVVPLLLSVPDAPDALGAVGELDVPAAWGDWLLQQFALGQGYLRESGTDLTELLDEADPGGAGHSESVRRPPASATAAKESPGPPNAEATEAETIAGPRIVARVTSPPWPADPQIRQIAEHLADHPQDPPSTPELAARFGISTRTLERRFVAQTGYGPAAWHIRSRVARAATLIADGRALNWVAHECGFATASGFSRTFSRLTGHPPSAYARAVTANDLGEAQGIVRLATRAEVTAAPPLLPTQTWPRINDFDVVVWLFRGTATVRVSGRRWHLSAGDAILLPAGLPNSVQIDADSLLLPLGSGRPHCLGAREVRPVHLPVEANDHLLHLVMAAQTLIHPLDHDPEHVVRSFAREARRRDEPGTDHRSAGPSVLVRMAVHLHRRPNDGRSQAHWAAHFGLTSAELGRIVRTEAGSSFASWRSQVRMTVARSLLDDGWAVSAVSRHVGYTHVSGFSKVFTDAHGVSPSLYQRGRG